MYHQGHYTIGENKIRLHKAFASQKYGEIKVKSMNRMFLVLVIITMVGAAVHTNTYAYEESDLEKLLNTGNCSNCDLTEADLSGKNLEKTILVDALLHGATLNGTNLSNSDLSGAILKYANLSHAKLIGTKLINANLKAAQLSGFFII